MSATEVRASIPANGENYHRPISNPDGPPSPRQIEALKKFGCQIPPGGVSRGQASAWLDWLVGKVKAGAKIDEDDTSGPPLFRKAIDYSTGAIEKAVSAPTGPVPASEGVQSPEASTALPGASDETDFMPHPGDWATCESEVVENEDGMVTSRRTVVKFASQADGRETFRQMAARLGAVASAEALRQASTP